MKRRSNHFTLLETLLVIAILTIAVSVIGFGFMQERGEQQYLNEVTALQQKLQAAELLMQLRHETVTVVIEGQTVTIQTDAPMSSIFNHIFNEHKKLSSFSSLTFITPDGNRMEGKIVLPFSAINQSTPQGTLLMSRGDEQRSIVMTGYIQPIRVEQGHHLQTQEEISHDYPRSVELEWERRGEKADSLLHTP